jgi:signal transduction histidine kinase
VNRPPRLTDLRHTTAFRLTAGLTVVFATAIFTALMAIYTQTTAELDQRTDQMIVTKARMLAASISRPNLDAAVAALHDKTSGLEGIAVFDAAGHRLIGDAGLAPPFPLGRMFDRQHGPRGAPVHALALPTADALTVVVSRDATPIRDLRARILVTMWIAGVGAVVLALGAGLALSLGPMRRIRRLEVTAARIAMGELDLRITIGPRGDEFDMIAGIINAMVEEIERLMRQVKAATEAVAHDLRTPLSHVRTRLERIALLPVVAGDPEGEAARLLTGARDELDAVLARFRALLRMAELEASHRRAQFAPFDPMAMMCDLAELYEPLAEERGLAVRVVGPAGLTIRGDERLLFEAVGNLVENAIKFSPPGGMIALGVADHGDTVAITVVDQGPGIAPAERALVLERFARGSGAATVAGSGLGLSLVAVIVALHDFELQLDPAGSDPLPGLAARIIAPVAVDLGTAAAG